MTKTIIFDLDETLVHTIKPDEDLAKCDVVLEMDIPGGHGVFTVSLNTFESPSHIF